MLARMKVTFDVDPELFRAIKVEAARADRSLKEVVAEALERWLEALEDAEDIAAAEAALAEYGRDGGIDAETFFRTLAAEHAAAYGTETE